MPIDLNKIKSRLSAISATSNKSTHLWKPKAGKQVIRIVPYKYERSFPFIELKFHYGVGGKNYLSPTSFGNPDPIVEFAESLQSSGDKDSWKEGKKLEPKMRTYVPIVVRGEEDEGVKFWGFGKTVYEVLLNAIHDPDYGDITDPETGRDITVEFKDSDKTAKSLPETTILIKPKTSPLTNDDKLTAKLLDEQVEITSVFPEPTYEELKSAFTSWMNSGALEEVESSDRGAPDDEVPATTVKKTVVDDEVTATTVKEEVPPTVKAANKDEIKAKFDGLFKSKK